MELLRRRRHRYIHVNSRKKRLYYVNEVRVLLFYTNISGGPGLTLWLAADVFGALGVLAECSFGVIH